VRRRRYKVSRGVTANNINHVTPVTPYREKKKYIYVYVYA